MQVHIRLFALALVLAGTLRIGLHLSKPSGVEIISCLGNVTTLPLAAPQLAHCWGCYAAGLGLVLFAASFIRAKSTQPAP